MVQVSDCTHLTRRAHAEVQHVVVLLARLLLLHAQLARLAEVNLGEVALQAKEHATLAGLHVFAVDVHLLGAVL